MKLLGLRVAVVGGSIAGLSVAAALVRHGADVVVLERGAASFERRGGGLGLSPELCRALALTERDVPRHGVLTGRRIWARGIEHEEAARITVTSYGLLWRWLYEQLPADIVELCRAVMHAEHGGEIVRLTTDDARVRELDLVVAADGGRSELRRAVLGPSAQRRYAGYVLWRGLVPMPSLGAHLQSLAGRLHIANRGHQHFVAYPIPDPGSAATALNWGWYQPTAEDALEDLERDAGSAPPHVLGRAGGAIARLRRVQRDAAGAWPSWVEDIVERTLAEGWVAPHPVYELAADTMSRGRIVLVGDAAHLASPLTGSGGRLAMDDALTLAESLEGATAIDEALASFSRRRVATCAAVVQAGHLRGAPFRGEAHRAV